MKQPIAPTPTPAQPGRPSGYCPEAVALLCDLIRQRGLSDSAAAEEAGLSTSALSRWKQQFPELRILLRQARAEFRKAHLENILQASRAEGSRGWRASAWLLERIFPEDYSPKAAEREMFQDLAADLREQEAAAELLEIAAPPLVTDSHNSRNSLLSTALAAASKAAPASSAPVGAGTTPAKASPAAQTGRIAPATVSLAGNSW